MNRVKSLFNFLLLINISIYNSNAQTLISSNFCSGNSGDPIFEETFGTGTGFVYSISSGTTTYDPYSGSGNINDGEYVITNNSTFWDWDNYSDHTGDTNGRYLIVNVDDNPSTTNDEFFTFNINGLCSNTNYEFSAYFVNLSQFNNNQPINIGFQILNASDNSEIDFQMTGEIGFGDATGWQPGVIEFSTNPGEENVILKLVNLGTGGIGNDLGIDDIVFRTCGDSTEIVDTNGDTESSDICEGDNIDIDLDVTSGYNYEWQTSTDLENWSYATGSTNSDTYNYTATASVTTYVRAKVAEDAANLSGNTCSTVSDYYTITVNEIPDDAVFDRTDIQICGSDTPAYSITLGDEDDTINWYDSDTAGNLEYTGDDFDPGSSGTYYVETVSLGGCISTNRIEVSFTYTDAPEVEDEAYDLCEGNTLTLLVNEISGLTTLTYLWNTGDTTESIDVTVGGAYTVEVTNGNCSVTKTINVTEVEAPNVTSVKTTGNNFTITTSNSGDFEYSIDGGSTYQSSNVFEDIEGGFYTLYAKNQSCTTVNEYEFYHLVFPSVITPNGDGYNDVLVLNDIYNYSDTFSCIISDKYGKILYSSVNEPVFWDGTSENLNMPSDDYWYQIVIDNVSYFGSFTLKRN